MSKAREAAGADGGGLGHSGGVGRHGREGRGNEEGHIKPEDVDSDEGWVSACVGGVRVLLEMARREEERERGVEWAKEAGNVVRRAREGLRVIGEEEKAKEGEEKERRASVDLAESLWEFVMAITGWFSFFCLSFRALRSCGLQEN